MTTAWPVKSREVHNHHMNSTVWNNFKFRDGDIVIATYGKSGTTWVQQIIAQLIFDGAERIEVSKLSPWIDFRLTPPEAIVGLEHLPHRRFVKTHLPADALVFSPKAKYLYIGRDGRDAAWSFYNHYANFTEERRIALNEVPGLVGPPLPPCTCGAHEFFRTWFENDGAPYWPFWEHIRSWWQIRHAPSVRLIHFNDMKADLARSIREIAEFLGLTPDEAVFQRMVEHCSFDYMKAHASLMAPRGGEPWKGGGRTFINKGTNGRWRDVLTVEEVKKYEAKALAELGRECANWLTHGKLASKE
jgi:aryl sulfotransferase